MITKIDIKLKKNEYKIKKNDNKLIFFSYFILIVLSCHLI